jgi:hypothetical protein
MNGQSRCGSAAGSSKRPWKPAQRLNPCVAAGCNAKLAAAAAANTGSPPPAHRMRQAVEALSRHAAVLALSAAVAASALTAAPAEAVTQEQLLFLEAWRAVDRAYFDKKFNGQNWFKASRCPAWQLYVPASPAFHTVPTSLPPHAMRQPALKIPVLLPALAASPRASLSTVHLLNTLAFACRPASAPAPSTQSHCTHPTNPACQSGAGGCCQANAAGQPRRHACCDPDPAGLAGRPLHSFFGP